MTTAIVAKLNARIERGKASDRKIARLNGMTVDEYDEDVMASDPSSKNDILVLDQCPLCDRYVGWIEHTAGGRWGYGLIFRYDLRGFVCERCDRELGPDEPRVRCLMLGGKSRQDALATLGYTEAQ